MSTDTKLREIAPMIFYINDTYNTYLRDRANHNQCWKVKKYTLYACIGAEILLSLSQFCEFL